MEPVGSTNKKHKANEDIISNLPDSLITNILSCVPTKDAARTSVLSKRWIDCWTFITKVNLDDSVFFKHKKKKSGGKKYFINFVNRALLTNSNRAESFSLVITNKYDVSLLNTWISCILKRNVKKLSIRLNLEFPFSAYTSDILFNYSYKLEELVLEMRCCSIKVPPCSSCYSCSFGSLNVLKLCGVIFTIDDSLGILFRTLKKFEMNNCCWLSTNDATLELIAPLLETVLIKQDGMSVNREQRSCKIKFSASCMKEFTYCGFGMSQAIILSDPSAARNASAKIILYKHGDSVQETQSCASLLLKQFSQVKCMEILGLEVLTKQNVAVLPKFAMLIHLNLGYTTGEVWFGLLHKTPVLNTLVFKGITQFNRKLLNSAVVADCLASSLQVVRFGTFFKIEHPLFLVNFFLEYGMVLERMSFSFFDARRKSTVIEEFKEKLYSFKKGVSFATLEHADELYSYDYSRSIEEPSTCLQ